MPHYDFYHCSKWLYSKHCLQLVVKCAVSTTRGRVLLPLYTTATADSLCTTQDCWATQDCGAIRLHHTSVNSCHSEVCLNTSMYNNCVIIQLILRYYVPAHGALRSAAIHPSVCPICSYFKKRAFYGTYDDCLSVRRRSPIRVVTGLTNDFTIRQTPNTNPHYMSTVKPA